MTEHIHSIDKSAGVVKVWFVVQHENSGTNLDKHVVIYKSSSQIHVKDQAIGDNSNISFKMSFKNRQPSVFILKEPIYVT